jgi:hypothetical protein
MELLRGTLVSLRRAGILSMGIRPLETKTILNAPP